MKNVLSYAEYQEKVKNINSPEEAAAFAQELLTPMIMGLRQDPPAMEEEDIEEERPVRAALSKRTKDIVPSPWLDVVANDNEAMVVDLYSKGMTTRSAMKRSRAS